MLQRLLYLYIFYLAWGVVRRIVFCQLFISLIEYGNHDEVLEFELL